MSKENYKIDLTKKLTVAQARQTCGKRGVCVKRDLKKKPTQKIDERDLPTLRHAMIFWKESCMWEKRLIQRYVRDVLTLGSNLQLWKPPARWCHVRWRLHAGMCIYTHTHMCIYVHVCIYVYVYVCIYTHICVYTYIYTHIYVYIYIYICTFTYICI